MEIKTKNTLIIFILFLLIAIGGGVFSFVYQSGKISDREKKIKELNLYQLDTKALTVQLENMKKRVVELDSILALRKYNIPHNLAQSRFFDFINNISYSFSPLSYVNIEYDDITYLTNYYYYTYKLSGTAEFNDLNKLVYSIEQSKQLKKIKNTSMTNFVKVDDENIPHYLVTYELNVAVYSSETDRFTTKDFKENSLTPNPLYDIFYPLIRNEIPPNTDNLLDVQNAQLLALIPDGAFLSNSNGRTYLLWEGDEVYLGYLTEIDYANNEVHFILNKGGIIDKVTLQLEKEKNQSK
jgi:hypothetical protein